MKRMHYGAVLLLAAAALLSACGSKVLEFENVKVANGKLYEGGGNEPFSGKVTNVPNSVVLGRQEGLPAVLGPLKLMFAGANSRYLDAILFSGALCDVTFKKGLPDGEMVCKQPRSEILRYQASFKDGLLDGPFKVFDLSPANAVTMSVNFKAGLSDGTEEVFSLKTHKVIYRLTWDKGVASGAEEAFHEDTGVLIGKSNYSRGVMDGEVVRYAPDGKRVIYHVKAAAGVKQGVEEGFDAESGKPLLYATWVNGKKEGPYRQWDADGTAIIDTVYANDQEVAGAAKVQVSSGIPFDNCVDEWRIAFQRKNGDQVAITADQMSEWKSSCRQWKKPPVNF